METVKREQPVPTAVWQVNPGACIDCSVSFRTSEILAAAKPGDQLKHVLN